MDSADILALLEKPTRDPWPFIYQIRDEAAVSDIVAALRASAIPHIRYQLCYILNLRARAEFFEGRSSETKQAVPALIEALADPDAGVREEAIDALGHIGGPTAGPALLEEYHKANDDSDLRILLASVVGFCKYRPAIPTLIEALSSSNDILRRQATWGLRHLKAQEAKAPLQQALATEADPLTRQTMQETLQELEHPSTREEKIDSLIAQIRDAKTLDERTAAATDVGDMIDQRALVPLLVLLHDEQGEIRQCAALALGGMGDSRDTDWFVRAHREQVLGPLIQALADQDAKVRAQVAQALCGWADKRAVEPLLAVVQDVSAEVRWEAVATLSVLKDERALEPLLNAFFTDEDLMVRAYAAEGLGAFEDNRALNTLVQGLQDEQSHVRKQAAELLCWLKDERATNDLIQALQDDDQEVREWAIEALWQLCMGKGDDLSEDTIEKMHNPLLQALQDESGEVKACAEILLAWLNG
ncbi:MAG: HEAT repeat domain-containing protein [Ktedonobacteraceae bacterium]